MKRILAFAGILGGAVWIGLAVFPSEWGPPGTADYARYELWNRLWTPALLGMALGFGGLFLSIRTSLTITARRGFAAMLIGFALMLMGNIAEFWIFTAVPYSGGRGMNIRDVAWMTFLLGTLLMLIGSTLIGFNWLKTARSPKWLSVLFLLPLPLTIGIGFIGMNWVGMPIGILSIVVGVLGFLPSYSGATLPSQA